MFISRYRFVWNKLTKLKVNYRVYSPTHTQKNPYIYYKDFRYKHSILSATLGFSLFTWLGFDKKVTAEDEIIETIRHCIIFIEKTDYVKAEQLLHVALRQAQQIHHQSAITYIYDIMANLALEREQLDKSKSLFIAVTQRLMGDGATEDDIRVVHISVKLARISHLKREYSTAQLGYDWCLKKLNNTVLNNPNEDNMKLLAIVEDWYGRLFLDTNQFEHGLKLMTSALNHMRKVSNVEKEHIMVQLNDIGTICDKLGRYDESIAYFKEAIEMSKLLPEQSEQGTFYINLGRAYLKKKLVEEARKSCGFGWKLGVIGKNAEMKKEAELCLNEIKNTTY